MGKFVGGVLLGVFVGAAVNELLARNPELLPHIKHKIRTAGTDARDWALRMQEQVVRRPGIRDDVYMG